ncbi:hypothetical protein AB0L40_20650 [Patulibacter sp. NPDC049589]|uniref:hypothetical protein n=1 Tax=Patulibacter sp. NPDC049589 TaxID=3154731 RepID=UPI0034305BE5
MVSPVGRRLAFVGESEDTDEQVLYTAAVEATPTSEPTEVGPFGDDRTIMAWR